MPDPFRPTVTHLSSSPDTGTGDANTAGPPADPAFGPPAAEGELGRLAHYRVVKQLGRGGMGAVFLGFDEDLRRKVALKVMLPKYAADAQAKNRFLREARAAAAVKHDHVVTIYQVGEAKGTPFIAMEYLTGYPLDEYLRRKGRVSVPQAVRVGLETAAGLAAAHALGLVHRDIKPANLWLEAPNGRVKILDFGLARQAEVEPNAGEVTGSGVIVGTPAFMAPEQARGEPVDARSDLFSLGAVLYLLVTGQQPFPGPTAMAILTALATTDPPAVRHLNPDVPPPLAALIHRLLEKDPTHRPLSADGVLGELRAISRGQAGQPPAVTPSATALPAQFPQPEVVYVQLPVTGPEQSAFEGLDDAVPAGAVVAPPKKPDTGKVMWAAAAGAVLLAAGLTLGTIYILNPKPKPTEPSAAVKPPDPPKPTPAPPAKVDPDRALAEWVLSKGGQVTLSGSGGAVSPGQPLPDTRFFVEKVTFADHALTDADLDRFEGVQKCDLIRANRTLLTDAGLERLAGFPFARQLTALTVNSPAVTDAGLAHLAKFPALTELRLAEMNVTAAGLAVLTKLPRLADLNLSGTKVSDAGLEPLTGLKLTHLDLAKTAVTDAGMKALARIPTLVLLKLYDTGITDAGLEALKGLPNLTYLALGNTAVGDAGLELLRGLKLTTLDLTGTKVTDAGLPVITTFPPMTSLVLNQTGVTNAGVEHLVTMKPPQAVYLKDTRVTTAGGKRLEFAFPSCKVTYTYDPKTDPDRLAAEWVFANGGAVNIREKPDPTPLTAATQLPAGPIKLTVVRLNPNHTLTDADIDRLRDCYWLVSLYAVSAAGLTDTGLEKLAGSPAAEKFYNLSLTNPKLTPAAVKHLARFRNLGSLGLDGAPVGDAGLKTIGALTNLNGLTLTRAGITDDGLLYLRGLGLTSLSLQGNPKVTDAGLAEIARHKKLTGLNLFETGITDAGLEPLAGLSELAILTLANTAVTNDGLKHLRAVPKLALLNLNESKITDAGLGHLAALPALNSLYLNNTAVTDDGLKTLAKCKGLLVLQLNGAKQVTPTGAKALQRALPKCNVIYDYNPALDPDRQLINWVFANGGNVSLVERTPVGDIDQPEQVPAGPVRVTAVRIGVDKFKLADADIDRLRDCHWLTNLTFSATGNLTEAGLAKLAALPCAGQLTQLVLNAPKLAPAGVALLAKFPALTHLRLADTPVGDAGLAVIGKLTKLDYLSVSNCGVTDAGLVHLRGLKLGMLNLANNPKVTNAGMAELRAHHRGLKQLLLGITGVTEAGLADVGTLTELTNLQFGGTAVTDDGLKHLRGLTKLGTLAVSQHVTDAGLVHLLPLTGLRYLILLNTAVTDEGLKTVAKMTWLTRLNLTGTKVTPAGVAAFRAAVPKCEVVSDFDKK